MTYEYGDRLRLPRPSCVEMKPMGLGTTALMTKA